LPELQWLEPFMQCSDAQREALFNSRAVWVPGLNGMSLKRYIFKRIVEKRNDAGDKQEQEVRVQGNLLTNWVINEDYLNTNPDFILPKTTSLKYT
jgi:hypothetical protein